MLSGVNKMMWAVAVCAVAPRVVVVGGTHGNEFTGIYVVEMLEKRRADLPADKDHHVCIIDAGHCGVQICIVKMRRDAINVLAWSYATDAGGAVRAAPRAISLTAGLVILRPRSALRSCMRIALGRRKTLAPASSLLHASPKSASFTKHSSLRRILEGLRSR